MARAELAGAERGWEERSNQLSALRDAFERRSREWQEYNQEFEEDLLKAIDGWKSASAAWDRARTAACERLESFRASYLNREPSAIMRYADIVLALSQWPAEFPRDATTGYDAEAKILVAELRLPNFDEITVLKPKGWELRAANQRETERTRRQVLYALCLRSLYELAANDEIAVFDSIACNGWIRFTDRATGHQRSEVVLSVHATRCQLLEINIGEVDAEAAFRALKGLAAPKLDAHVPVAPILRINRDDKRIVPGRDVLEALNDAANLAAMDWEDFEHLIRQVFELEWAHEGAEVRVTQASRDKGVDALIFDPDPLRGGKFVIQAKRYTRVVDVSAVRDLYGTVVNEGANRGILVTTSSYGPDAYEFAKGKPLTLLTGANLLQLLDKHGYRFRINLEEARALALDQG
jgi:restriction system protein